MIPFTKFRKTKLIQGDKGQNWLGVSTRIGHKKSPAGIQKCTLHQSELGGGYTSAYI